MKKQNNPKADSDKLRQEAEALLKGKLITKASHISEADAIKLIQELQIYQVELEMQNKELILAQELISETAAQKYAELYDFAPLGYFTLSREGKISMANLHGTALLGKERSRVGNDKFDLFVSNDTKPLFNLFLRKVFERKSRESCEVVLVPDGRPPMYVQLTGALIENGEQCLMTVVDITERHESELALFEKNSRLEFVMQAAEIAWWEMDITTGNISFGKMKAEMLGYPPEKFSYYKDFMALVHPDDYNRVMDSLNGYINGVLNKHEVEYRILTYSGGYKWVCEIGSVIKRDVKGNPLNITGLVINITGRKEAREALQESETKFRMIADFAYDWEYWIGKDEQIIYISPSCERISGYTAGEFLSDNLLLKKIIHPEDQKITDEHFEGTISSEYSQEGEDLDFRILKKDGSVVNIAHLCRPVFDDMGNYLGRRISNRDNTRRKRSEATLNNERLLLRTLIDNIPDSIYSKDLECRKTLANLTEVHYMGAGSEAEVLGKNDFDIYPEELAEKFFADDQTVIQTGKPVLNREEYILDENGTKRWLLSSKLPLYDKDGGIIGLVGIGRDITNIKQAQMALQESEELYRNLVEKLPDGVYKSTHKGKFVDVNPALVNMFGYESKEEMLAIDIKTQLYFMPSDRESVELNEKLEKVGVYRMKKKDGSEIWVEDHGWLNLDEKQNILYHEGIMRDVTESKRAEWALLESEALYRNLVERLPDGIYKSTHDGKIIDVNPAMFKMLGYENKEELLNIDIKTQLYFEPTDRESVELQEKFEEIGVYRLKKKDGSAIWVEDHGWYIPDENGNILFHEGIIRDITERKQAEKALEYEHYLLNSLMNNVPAQIYFKDHESRLIRINKALANSFGLSDPGQAVGKTDFDFFALEYAQQAFEDEQEIIRTGKPVIKEEKETWPNQPDTWVSTTKMPLLDQDGNIIGTFGISAVITERKHAEDELKLKNEQLQILNIQKDKFFSIIAHDLRGPLSSFLELTEILAEGIPEMTLDEIQKIARVMKTSTANINQLIGNLLEWSLMQRGITSYNPVSYLLLPKIQDSLALPKEAASKKEIVINYGIPDDLQVFADGNMLEGILRNLVTNAVKFTSKGGRIHISAIPINNNHVQVSVMDTGIGMNKDMIADLFRLDINTSRKGTEGENSSGLGLIICKDFIEKHGGVLWVESQEGKGSTFHFTLPQNAKLPETPPVQNNAPAKEADQAAKKLKILIAENDETSEMLISIAVKPFSKEVLTVRSGVDAVEACRNNPDIDLILMDIQMPWMNGYEATRLIRQFNKEVIIIAQTAYSQIDDRENAIESGCNYYISKPLNLSLLKELLQKHF